MNEISELLGWDDGSLNFYPKGTNTVFVLSNYPELESKIIALCEKELAGEIEMNKAKYGR